jgi:two-component system, chemotaxis family, CheB/CheR fusion protein
MERRKTADEIMAETTQRAETPDEPVDQEQVESRSEKPHPAFLIVGIGASAGGVSAFEAFFSAMPADNPPGMAFVLVQHLARDHKSILSELIRRYTRMQVFDVGDGMAVKPNCAYIIPPNRDMALMNGALQLLEPTLARGVRLPIDFFFRSLAQDQHDRAICIVLSGTGSDGALGVRAVKGEGGMVMAQTPESTEFDGMPRSAIATGMVDFVLTPNQMPAKLLDYASHTLAHTFLPAAQQAPPPGDGLEKIFLLLRSRTGHDFSQYKRNTILRRVARRMAVHQIDRLEDYLRYLQLTRSEVDALFRDLLIGVTNFFRDTEIFEEIRKQVIPQLLAGKTAGSVIRVWVPGCSTGEEAYSIAILFRERMEEMKENFKVQVFATDIDSAAIDHARAGIYPSSIIADVSAERLAHFFDQDNPDGSAYRIRRTVRDMLIFSEHDLIKDPPFSKLDLISCRNLLIYMGPELQKRLMPLFHYALNPGGMLVLGSSESVGEFANLFSPVDRSAKIFRRKAGESGTPRIGTGRSSVHPPEHEIALQTSSGPRNEKNLPLHEIAMRTVLAHYSPVGALVNDRGDILYLLGRTGRYLEPTPGEASLNIFRMAREGLRGDLTIALHRAFSLGISAHHTGLRVKSDDTFTNVDLTVLPVPGDTEDARSRNLFLVILEEKLVVDPRTPTEAAVEGVATLGPDLDTYILRLKQELRGKDEYLQTTIEELETSNEELRSAHEEMQSVNEEMQSTNEELETSKEELQSANEELATVNVELQTKVADLSRSNNDMVNLLSGTGIATLFVDHLLRILRFNSPISALINLIETDVGRPVDQIRSSLVGYDHLGADVKGVLENLVPKELEVQTHLGDWYLLRIRPYRTLENVIDGAVITFTDISILKKAQAALQNSEALQRLAVVVRDSRDAILVQDMTGRILAWNHGAEKMYGWTEAEALTMNIRELMPKDNQDQTSEVMRRGLSGELDPQRTQRLTKDGRILEVSLIVSPLANAAGKTYAIATTERGAAP